MRIFLLPLTTRQALVYCQKTPPKPGAKRGIIDKINLKAAETWVKWEQAGKGWQKQVVTYGNRALQRIPYQEWALKSFPPTSPPLQAQVITDDKKYEVVYPGNVMDKDDVPKVLGRLARERKQLHHNRFWGSLVGIPFTIPFAIIPVIPNLPFFYLSYRAWSHWRALRGSDHLDFLLDHRLLKPVSTPEVESIYTRFAPYEESTFDFVTAAEVEEGKVKQEQLLLPAGAHTDVANTLHVPELSGEVERALWQIEQASKKSQEAQQRGKEEEQQQQQQQTKGEHVDTKHDQSKQR